MQASPLEARATLPAMRLTSKRWRDIVDDSIRVCPATLREHHCLLACQQRM